MPIINHCAINSYGAMLIAQLVQCLPSLQEAIVWIGSPT